MPIMTRIATLVGIVLSSAFLAAQTPDEHHHTASQKVDLHIKIAAENMATLPAGATVEMKGDEDRCKDLLEGQTIVASSVNFQDVPVCKVRLDVVITGFNVNRVKVDLASYKEPMEIKVNKAGSAAVSMGPKTPAPAGGADSPPPSH